MELTDIKIGTKFEIETVDNRQVFISQYEWLEEENKAVIAAPIYEGYIVPLETGTLIDVYFLDRQKKLIDLYKFRAMIIGRSVVDNLHVLLAEKLGEIVRIQRRNFFRLNVLLEVWYRVVTYSNKEYNEDIPFKKTLATDLSGGGISLILEEKLGKDCNVECEIFRGRPEMISFTGKTVRCERIVSESKYSYSVGIEFVDISDNDREKVIRFIFDEQRKLIKKGMI